MTACLAGPGPGPGPADPGAHLRRAVALMRTGAAALEARRPADAVRALGAAVDHLVSVRLAALAPGAGHAPEGPVALACVRAARRLTDAALLGDAALAREAERVVAPLLAGARRGEAR
ncbi:hypothetical protein ACOQFB_14445 [Anaeromyxobacter sp. Red801]|uniref:hypothetical protein n=1 Tax=Anaeromyxobacter sp. Red801 TaxID=3411632 RepID=UPI003BA3C7D4